MVVPKAYNPITGKETTPGFVKPGEEKSYPGDIPTSYGGYVSTGGGGGITPPVSPITKEPVKPPIPPKPKEEPRRTTLTPISRAEQLKEQQAESGRQRQIQAQKSRVEAETERALRYSREANLVLSRQEARRLAILNTRGPKGGPGVSKSGVKGYVIERDAAIKTAGTRWEGGVSETILQPGEAELIAVGMQEKEQEPIFTPAGAVFKTYVKPKEGSYGLGGHFEYETAAGEYAGREYQVLQATEEKPKFYTPTLGKAMGIYEQLNIRTGETLTEPFIFKPLEKIGVTKEKISGVVVGPAPFGVYDVKAQEFGTGFVEGLYTDIREKPFKQVALVGAGYGLGFAVGGVSAAAYSIPKIGAVTGAATKIGMVGTGATFAGIYAVKTGKDIYTSGSYEKAGRIIGVSAKDLALIGYGSVKGAKGFKQVKGFYETRGREFIDIPKGEYPTAPVKTQLKLFRQNVYQQLGEKPGAFHVTSDKFWSAGEITPTAGTSELPGLYGATKISTPFARLGGTSGVTPKFSLKIAVKDFLAPPGKPGVAYLQPEAFRYSPAGKVKPYTIDGQQFSQAFYKPAKPGVADVPGIKSEIEAVFRPSAGGYAFTGGKYYTTISGVRVPIDTFKYDPSVLPGVTKPTGEVILIGGRPSYALPSTSYPLILPSYAPLTPAYSVSDVSARKSLISIPSSSSLKSSLQIPSSARSYAPSKKSSMISSLSSAISSDVSKLFSQVSSKVSKISYGPSGITSGLSKLIPGRPIVPPPTIFDMPRKTHGEIGKMFKPRKFKGRYAPSVYAIGEGITALKIPKTYEAGFGALTLRPMIIGKRTKRKQKTKKTKHKRR